MANRTSDRTPSVSFSTDHVRKTCPPVSSAHSRKAGGTAPDDWKLLGLRRVAPALHCLPHRPWKQFQSPRAGERSLRFPFGQRQSFFRPPLSWDTSQPEPLQPRTHPRCHGTTDLEFSTKGG